MEQLKQAVIILREKKASCVMLKEDGEVHLSYEMGIKPLMQCLRKDKKAFINTVIADKVIGKSAALLVILGGASAVHGEIMSEEAKAVLERFQIPYAYQELVPYIQNRTKTGRCPLEQSVYHIENPETAFDVLEKTIDELMKRQKSR